MRLVPPQERLDRHAELLNAERDRLLDRAVELRRRLQDSDAELDALDVAPDIHDPSGPFLCAYTAQLGLYEVERQLVLAQLDLVPADDPRRLTSVRIAAWLRTHARLAA